MNRSLKRIVVASAFAVAAVAGASPLHEEKAGEPDAATSASPFEVAALERAFWMCDYIGTTEGALAAPIALCTTVTQDLKDIKFEGDFDRMVAWWRENKRAEFAKLERSIGHVAERGVSAPGI